MPAATNEAPTPPGSALAHAAGRELSGFRKFILRGNVVDLAVGIVIGAAFSNVAQSLDKDFITPLIGIIGGTPDFANYAVSVRGRTPVGARSAWHNWHWTEPYESPGICALSVASGDFSVLSAEECYLFGAVTA